MTDNDYFSFTDDESAGSPSLYNSNDYLWTNDLPPLLGFEGQDQPAIPYQERGTMYTDAYPDATMDINNMILTAEQSAALAALLASADTNSTEGQIGEVPSIDMNSIPPLPITEDDSINNTDTGMDDDEDGDDEEAEPSSSTSINTRSKAKGKKTQKELPPYPKHISEVDPDKKLSSRERRQIRNKISARNFRERRKEHISTLEAEVAQLKEQVTKYKVDAEKAAAENEVLKRQLEAIKRVLPITSSVAGFNSSGPVLSSSRMTAGRKAVDNTITTSGARSAPSNYYNSSNTNNLIRVNSVFALPEPNLQEWKSELKNSSDTEVKSVDTTKAEPCINASANNNSVNTSGTTALPPLDPKTLLKWISRTNSSSVTVLDSPTSDTPTSTTTITYPTLPTSPTTKQLLLALKSLYEAQKLGIAPNSSLLGGTNVSIPQEAVLAKLVLIIMAFASQRGPVTLLV